MLNEWSGESFCRADEIEMQLSAWQSPLCFAPYAEISCSQQNAQSGSKALQDNGARQDIKGAILTPAFAFVQECETQTSIGQSGARGQDRCCPDQGKSAVRLRGIGAARGARALN